mmetsp:Transcript_25189/g.73835  ORF Transcript_25189/g.73835 Transcript_25189/m.73835 type:complete len:200 (+) Transcript_25189:1139-1738(+)
MRACARARATHGRANSAAARGQKIAPRSQAERELVLAARRLVKVEVQPLARQRRVLGRVQRERLHAQQPDVHLAMLVAVGRADKEEAPLAHEHDGRIVGEHEEADAHTASGGVLDDRARAVWRVEAAESRAAGKADGAVLGRRAADLAAARRGGVEESLERGGERHEAERRRRQLPTHQRCAEQRGGRPPPCRHESSSG